MRAMVLGILWLAACDANKPSQDPSVAPAAGAPSDARLVAGKHATADALHSDGPPKTGDPIADFLAVEARRDLPGIRALLDAAKVEEATDACARTRAESAGLTGTPEYDKLAAEYDELCGVRLHVFIVQRAVELVEAQRKKKPKGDLADCFSGEYITAQRALTKLNRGDEPAVDALRARFKAVCPGR